MNVLDTGPVMSPERREWITVSMVQDVLSQPGWHRDHVAETLATSAEPAGEKPDA